MQQDIVTVHLPVGNDRLAGCKATIKITIIVILQSIEIRCFSAQRFYLALLKITRFYQ